MDHIVSTTSPDVLLYCSVEFAKIMISALADLFELFLVEIMIRMSDYFVSIHVVDKRIPVPYS